MNEMHGGKAGSRQLYGAAELADFCQVDLKTIHNWAERGEVDHFKTPGGHLRFRRADVLDLLRRYGFPLPEELRTPRPRILVWDRDSEQLLLLRRVLQKRFDVTTCPDGLEALLTLGRLRPDAFVLDLADRGLDGLACIERMRSLEPTRHVRTLVYSKLEELRHAAAERGAYGFVTKGDPAVLRRALVRLLGLEHG